MAGNAWREGEQGTSRKGSLQKFSSERAGGSIFLETEVYRTGGERAGSMAFLETEVYRM